MQYTNEIHEKALWFLLIKGLTLKHAHGYSRKLVDNSVTNVPQLLGDLTGNLSVTGQKLFDDFGYKYFNAKPAIDFGFYPEFDLKLLKKDIDQDLILHNLETGSLNRERKVGGDFSIWFSSKLKSSGKGWLGIGFGYTFILDNDSRKKQAMRKYLYCWISGMPIGQHELFLIKGIPSEEVCYQKMLRCLDVTISRAFKNTKDMPSHFRKKLLSFQKEIREHKS